MEEVRAVTADTEQTSYSSTQDPKEPCLSLQDIAGALGAEALFVSPVQPSDNAANALIRAAVTEAIAKLGSHGCAAMVG